MSGSKKRLLAVEAGMWPTNEDEHREDIGAVLAEMARLEADLKSAAHVRDTLELRLGPLEQKVEKIEAGLTKAFALATGQAT